MSVVLPTDTWATILPVIDSLGRLGAASSLEVILVMPDGESAKVDPGRLARFALHRIVGMQSILPLGRARAAGIRAATGRWVFIGETHSFPMEGMFEALAAEHEAGCTMAVPSFHNWNPDGPASWAGFIIGYATWTQGRESVGLASAPIFNVSYAREFLAGMGDRLDTMLSEGEDVIAELVRGGHRITFVPDARIAHANIAAAGTFLRQRWLSGRVIAGTRGARWSFGKRCLYAAASPLVPLVLLRRHRDGITRVMRRDTPPRATLALVMAGIVAQAAGELAGYVAGAGPRVRNAYDTEEIRRLDTAGKSR
jgi:hypothetical protein